MSSMRNAVHRRNHKERAQPLERKKWGLLEKHKDYSKRAADHNLKKRKLQTLQDDKSALFGKRYTDDPARDDQLEQRQQLLSGTDRLERSSGRLRESQRLALETEDIGRNTLSDLAGQREVIEHTRGTLLESEGYTDRSNKTLRGMARRYLPNFW